ncbi:MAG: CatA-like O-acetyltransferase [Christensenellaceae bacterium]
MKYEIIDFNAWERAKIFNRFYNEERSVMNLNVDVDVTNLLAYCKANDLKFYPAMIWVVSKVVNSHEEFRYGFDDKGNLILWDSLSPFYTDFNKDEQIFVKLFSQYVENIDEFCRQFLLTKEKYSGIKGFELENLPDNTFEISCLPWIRYNSFNIHFFDEGKRLSPVVTWGKFETTNGRAVMPLTLIVNHAVADGFHLSRFFIEVQRIIDSL